MEDGSDSEYEEEETVVQVELNGIIDSNFLLQDDIPCKILGIDSETPILKLGQYTFAGEYEDTLGTVIAYEKNESEKDVEKKYKFIAKTDKKLVMKRVFVQEKTEESLQKSVLSNVPKVSPEKECPLQEIKEKKKRDRSKRGKSMKENRNISKRKLTSNITNVKDKVESSSHVDSVGPINACVSDVNEMIEKSITDSKSCDINMKNQKYPNKKQTCIDGQAAKRKEMDDGDTNSIANKKRNLSGKKDFMSLENVDLAKSLQVSSDAAISQDMDVNISESESIGPFDSTLIENIIPESLSQQKTENTEKSFTSELKENNCVSKLDFRNVGVLTQASPLTEDSAQIQEKSIGNEDVDLQIQSTDNESFMSSGRNLPKSLSRDNIMNDVSTSSIKQIDNVIDAQSSDQSDVIEIQIVVEECQLSDSQNVSMSEPNKANNTLLISNEQEGQAIITLSFSDQAEIDQDNRSVSGSVVNDTLNEVLDDVTDQSKLPDEINLKNQFLKETNPSTITMQLSFDSDSTSSVAEEKVCKNVRSLDKFLELPENICESPDCSSTSASDASEIDKEKSRNIQLSDKNLGGTHKHISPELCDNNSLSKQMPTLNVGDSDDEKEFSSLQRNENLQSEQMPTISLEAMNVETTVIQSCEEESQNIQMSSSSLKSLKEKTNSTHSDYEKLPSLAPLEDIKENISTTQSPKKCFSSEDDSKDVPCEVSQSFRNNSSILFAASVISDSNECDEQVLNPVSEIVENEFQTDSPENVSQREIHADNSMEENLNKSHSRKLSSCEVTQSCNSKAETLNEENVNECDVFLQNSLPGFENFANASSSKRDALVSADEGLKEDDIVRHSITSEGSTSEISQSHRVESCSTDEVVEQVEFCNIEHCSQSTSSVSSGVHPTESKDLCVSSCDAERSIGPVFLESETKNISCEVSQSDRSENQRNADFKINVPNYSSDLNDNSVSGGHETPSLHFSNQENYCEVTESYEAEECIHSESVALLPESNSSECEPVRASVDGAESMTVLSDNREPCASSDCTGPSASDITAENSASCEVTQSSSTENISIENEGQTLNSKLHTSECEVYEESDYISEDSTIASASDSQSLVSSVILSNQEEVECINPSCEVSQSFKSIEDNNLPFEECCVSSDEGNEFSTHYATIEENKITDEVSQSVTMPIPLMSEVPNYELSECDQPGLVSHSDELFSNDQNELAESSKEVCSSDEINAASGNLDESISNSACEVTQSNRPEEGILIPHSQDLFENESLNECEASGKTFSSLEDRDAEAVHDSDAKNICESSDDIEFASSENLISTQKQFENDNTLNSVSQSSRYDLKISDLREMNDENELNERMGIETENIDSQSNLCESSERMQTDSTADPCTSSDKVVNEDTYELTSNDKLCDSISNPDASIYIEDKTGSISQSERDLNNTFITSSVPSSIPPYNTVTVSSSVDISSNLVGIVYSSQITHFTPEQEVIYISNSEVSQSSMQLNQQSSSSEDSNEVENSLCSDNSLTHPSVIVSSDTNITSNTLENIESNNEQVSDSNVIQILTPEKSTPEFIESSCTRVESSSPDILPETDKKKKKVCSPDKEGKGTVVVKKFGRRMKFIPKVACKTKEEKGEQSTNEAADISRDTSLNQQPTSESSSVKASANITGSNTDSRPSLLEVIVSSASDFRNSLIHDNNNFDKVTSPSEIAESSNSNNDSHNESSDLYAVESGYVRENPNYSQFHSSDDNTYSDNVDNDSLVTESVAYDEEKDNNNSQYRVSQSSEITNIYSSVIVSGMSENENVSESSQHQLVQSTSGVIKRSSQSVDDTNTNELVASAPKICGTSEVSDSSHAKFVTPSPSNDNVALDNNKTRIESSDDVSVCAGNLSVGEMENTDANVTSTPLETNNPKLQNYSADGSDQCSMIEGTDDVLFSRELVQSRLNIYSADGSGQCALIECTDGVQTRFDGDSSIRTFSIDRSTGESLINRGGSSELPESKDISNLNITSDSKVSGSHDHKRSRIWRSRFQEENCASSSMDENSTTDNASRTRLLIDSEASNEAEVLKTRFVDRNDSENFFLVSESGQIVINQSIPPESVDSPSDYNENNYKQDISQSSSADQTLPQELYSENNEATLFPLQRRSFREVSMSNETCSSRLTEEIESSGNSVVPGEPSQNILLASSDSSIYTQSVDFNNGSIHSSSLEVLQYSTDEQIVASSLSSTMHDRIETVDSVPSQRFDAVDERNNVSQSYIDETEPQQIPEVLESNEVCDVDRPVTSSDSHSSDYIIQEDDCDNSC